jgi:putative colanic acid biosynthesis acetyltransferase WcaF
VNTVDLSTFDNSWYSPGASRARRAVWFIVSALFVASRFPFSRVKVGLLRMFGARVGLRVVVKPSVHIKSPWLLEVGDNAWIGEQVWIDNLVRVTVGPNACISQGALLLTGNHNYRKPRFDLMTGEIVVCEGTWIGARAVVCPGVTCGSHAVLTVGSVATASLEPYGIYQGNPASRVRDRVIK